MSDRERTVPGTLRFWSESPRSAEVTIRERTVGERVRRALAALGIAWGIAIVSVLIPVAHFVLVPGFALGGIVVAVLRFLETTTVVRVRGTCPKCAESQEIAVGQKARGTLTIECPGCRGDLQLETNRAPDA